jgi:hypothetical protein
MVATSKSKPKTTVEYLYDAKGKPIKVLINYEEYVQLLEDVRDLSLSDVRLLEPDVPLPSLNHRGKVQRSA